MKHAPFIRLFVLVFALFASAGASLWSQRALNNSLLAGLKALPFAPKRKKIEAVYHFTFTDPSSLKGWEEKVFRRQTRYTIEKDPKGSFLRAHSEASSSGLYKRMDVPVTPDLFLVWRWRANKFPVKKEPSKLSSREQDDFAARVYVIFAGSNFFDTDVIEYLWDAHVEAGSVAHSPFTDRVKLFVVQKGAPNPAAAEGWQSLRRNIYSDYQSLFNRPPGRPLGAIALMSDSDNTGTSSEADFRFIRLEREQNQNRGGEHAQ